MKLVKYKKLSNPSLRQDQLLDFSKFHPTLLKSLPFKNKI